MKKVLAILTLVCMSVMVSAQTKSPLSNLPKSYVSFSNSVFNTGGDFGQKAQPTLEVGLTAYKTSVGLALGFTAYTKGNFYSEVRVSPTLWSNGKFAVNGAIGAGYVFTPKQLLTEWGGGVNYSITPAISAGLFGGLYNFSNKYGATKATFSGLSLGYTF